MDKDHQLENLKKDLEAKGNLVEVTFLWYFANSILCFENNTLEH